MAFVVITFVVIVLMGVKKRKIIGCEEYVVGCQQSKCLKGICAIEIMLGHIGLVVNSPYLFPFRKAGILVVGVFFFLSGYGLNIKAKTAGDSLSKYIIRKIISLIIALLVSNLVYVVAFWEVHKNNTPWEMAGTIIGIELINYPTWYLYELIIFYGLFALLSKHEWQYTVKILMIIVTMGSFAGYFSGIDSPWYGSAFCFILGILFNCEEPKLKALISNSNSRHYWSLITLATAMAIGMAGFFVLGDESFLGDVLCRNIASVSFSAFLYLLLFRWEIKGGVYEWLNTLAIYIYLYHMLMIDILQNVKWISDSDLSYSITVLAGSILLAQIIVVAKREMRKVLGCKKERNMRSK